MKQSEVKEKDKNRRSCCERYVSEFMLGNINSEYILKKMKINAQLYSIVEKKLSDTKNILINIPIEMWTGRMDGCVDFILTANEDYAHIAKYVNAIHKNRINSSKYIAREDYMGKPVAFSFDGARFVADFYADLIKIESVGCKIVNFIIY